MKYQVIIPYESFTWFGEDDNPKDCLWWLEINVGEPRIDWEADGYRYSADHAIFVFKREEDAFHFKLRWL